MLLGTAMISPNLKESGDPKLNVSLGPESTAAFQWKATSHTGAYLYRIHHGDLLVMEVGVRTDTFTVRVPALQDGGG